MNVRETELPGVLVLTPKIYRDNRGEFFETFNLRGMTDAGLPSVWTQDNFSFSRKNVLRGIHYQVQQPQGKLVRVTQGAVLDVAVDLRKSSATFGKYTAVELNAVNGDMLWIPVGFGHGFLVLSEPRVLPTKLRTTILRPANAPSRGTIRISPFGGRCQP